ncbi:MAG: sigma-70 family RNA polymerase sigma factor [Bacteroidaceae bacterium]|nr:sigma-70 family RNA polymerase sigma factor [Bacteroidaceae bacterium]
MQYLCSESDETLVKFYENGNDEAFDVLLERYQKIVYGFILTMVCDVPTADDIFQDTFYKAIVGIRSHRYTENGRFKSWLLRIANNLIVDRYRKREPVVDVPTDKDQERLFNREVIAEGNIEDDYHNNQTLSDIHKMIERLPAPQQEVVRLRIFEKMSFKEIAEITHCSINTALGRMRYATINLRRMAARYQLDLTFMKQG